MLNFELPLLYPEVVSYIETLSEYQPLMDIYEEIEAGTFCDDNLGNRRVKNFFTSALRDSTSAASASAVCRLSLQRVQKSYATNAIPTDSFGDIWDTSMSVLAHKNAPAWSDALICVQLLDYPQWQDQVLQIMPLVRKSLHETCGSSEHPSSVPTSCITESLFTSQNRSSGSSFMPSFHSQFHGYSHLNTDSSRPELDSLRVHLRILERDYASIHASSGVQDSSIRLRYGNCADGVFQVTKKLVDKIKNCASENETTIQEYFHALRGLESLRILTESSESAVHRCIAPRSRRSPESEMLRVAAVETLAVQPCSPRSTLTLTKLIWDSTESSELRIASYLSLLACDADAAAAVLDKIHLIDDANVLSYMKSRHHHRDKHRHHHHHHTSPIPSLFQEISQRLRLYAPAILRDHLPLDAGVWKNLDIFHLLDLLSEEFKMDADIIYDGGFLPKKIGLEFLGRFWRRFGQNIKLGMRLENFEGFVQSLLHTKLSTSPSSVWQMKLLEIFKNTALNFIGDFIQNNDLKFNATENSINTGTEESNIFERNEKNKKQDSDSATDDIETNQNFFTNAGSRAGSSSDSGEKNYFDSRSRRSFTISDLQDMMGSLFSHKQTPTAIWLWLRHGGDLRWNKNFAFTLNDIRLSLRLWLETHAEDLLKSLLNNEELFSSFVLPLSHVPAKLHPIAGPPLHLRSHEGLIFDGRMRAGLHIFSALWDSKKKLSGGTRFSVSSYRHLSVLTETQRDSIWQPLPGTQIAWGSSLNKPLRAALDAHFELTIENSASLSLSLHHEPAVNMASATVFNSGAVTSSVLLAQTTQDTGESAKLTLMIFEQHF
ncbi:uncharacterized protein LOC125179312 [Hyalella azteca]|uniref:Uncharacterized protein LOC125179312 n=1 Tax=Hyalella azteca TaxID=294128 RepID=A0A979FWX2_HYAAZ|nr:uncharacterized protein LOC125179312 [Hyalella azteca]